MHKRHRRTHKKLNRRRRTQRGGMSFSEMSDWLQSKNPFKASDTPTLSLTERMKQGWSSFKFPWSSDSKPAPSEPAPGSKPASSFASEPAPGSKSASSIASEPASGSKSAPSIGSRSVRNQKYAVLRGKQEARFNPPAVATSSPAFAPPRSPAVAPFSKQAVAPFSKPAVATRSPAGAPTPSPQAILPTLSLKIKNLLKSATLGNVEKSSIEYTQNLKILLDAANLIADTLKQNGLPVKAKGVAVDLPLVDYDGADRVINEYASYLNTEDSNPLFSLLKSSKKMGGRSNRRRNKRRTQRR